MSVEVIDSIADFKKIESNWNLIYEADEEAQFFLSWKWLHGLLTKRKMGWNVLCVKLNSNDKGYIAFLPILLNARFSQRHHSFHTEIRMAGTYFWADYTGLICHPNHEDFSLSNLAEKLLEMQWAKLTLKNFSISNSRFNRFISHFDQNHYTVEHRSRMINQGLVDNLICPYVKVPDSFDHYLSTQVSANNRQKIRRYFRKIEDNNELRIRESTLETADQDVNILIDFWKDKWRDAKGERTEKLANKYREILDTGLADNLIYLPVLWRDEIPLGALASFIDRKKKSLFFFVSGRDESFKNPPPGLVLHAHSIRWAIENGIKTYDFLRGNENYKYSFGATDRSIKFTVIRPKSVNLLKNRLDHASVEQVVRQATRDYENKLFEKAESGYEQILDLQPNHLTVLRRYGRLLYEMHRFKEASDIYQRLVDGESSNAGSWMRLGRSLFAQECYREAESALRTAITLHPEESVGSHYYLARVLQMQKNSSEAIAEFNLSIQQVAKNSWETKLQKIAAKTITSNKIIGNN